MNLPNKLTVFRIILVPIMVIIPFLNIQGKLLGIPISWIIIDTIFIIASITDKLDGSIARKKNLVTNFGKFLDPIADKILVVSALIILIGLGKLPTWIPIIIIIREFAVSGYRLIAVESNGEVIAANKWGKIKTVTQMFAIIVAFIDINEFGAIFTKELETIPFIINLLTTSLMILCTISTIFSGYEYMKNGKDLLKDM